MTYQIIYSSVSSTPMEQDVLQSILERARSNNARSGITGALVYADGSFLQILEGEKSSVSGLMEAITSDIRHERVTILQAAEMSGAVFSDWNMAYVSATPEEIARWIGVSRTTRLPDMFRDMAHDRQRTAQFTKSILAVLLGEPESDRQTPARQ